MIELQLKVYDYVRIGFMGLAFVSTLFQGQEMWLKADMLLAFVVGTGSLLFPHEFLTRQLTDAKSVQSSHLALVRIYGAILLGASVVWYKCRKSKDESVIGTMLWSRSLGLLFQILTMLNHLIYVGNKFTDFFAYFILGSTVLWLLANTLQILRKYPKLGHYEQGGALTWVFRLDFFITFLAGLAFMAFPQVFTWLFAKESNYIHRYITQLLGGSMLGNVWMSWYGTSFYLERDKKAIFLSRILTTMLIMAVLLYGNIMEGYPKVEHMWMLFMWYTPLLLGVAGLLVIQGQRQIQMKKK